MPFKQKRTPGIAGKIYLPQPSALFHLATQQSAISSSLAYLVTPLFHLTHWILLESPGLSFKFTHGWSLSFSQLPRSSPWQTPPLDDLPLKKYQGPEAK